MKELVVFNRTKGIHSTVDPRQHSYSATAGFEFLELLINMDVTDGGGLQTREGYSIADASSAYDSLFYWDAVLYCVAGGSLYSIGRAGAKTGIRSGLVEAKVRYCGVGDYIFYSNGVQNGYLYQGVSYPWAPEDYVGPDTVREIQAVPPCRHLGLFRGRIYYSIKNVLYYTEAFHYTGTNLTSDYIPFQDDIVMVLPLDGILIVATDKEVIFLQGENPNEFALRTVLSGRVIEDTGVVAVSPVVAGVTLAGRTGIFTTQDGIYSVTEGGEMQDITGSRLHFPASLSGNAYIKDNFYTVFIDD